MKKVRFNNGTLSENPEKIANTLNDYFVNIGPELASKLKNPLAIRTTVICLVEIEIHFFVSH